MTMMVMRKERRRTKTGGDGESVDLVGELLPEECFAEVEVAQPRQQFLELVVQSRLSNAADAAAASVQSIGRRC
jgi:hypothetical protein